jgi:hypothetical protein
MSQELSFPLPAVHLNGTGRETLLKEWEEAYKSLNKAFNALLDTTCHGRDYYVIDDNAYSQARDKRIEMRDKLQEVCEYAQAHYYHLKTNGK